MAKSFNAPSSPVVRPLAEQDFFDLLATPPPTGPASTPPGSPDQSATGVPSAATGNTGSDEFPTQPGNQPVPGSGGNPLNPALPDQGPGTLAASSSGNSRPPGKRSQPRKPGNTTPLPVTPVTEPTLEPGPEAGAFASLAYPLGDVRQTFILSQAHLEQLLDFVHARRAAGDYLYSQKQALHQALELLFASQPTPIPPRPESLRALERERRTRIQAGRQGGSKG